LVVVADKESVTAALDADIAVATLATVGVDTELLVNILDVAADETAVFASDTVLALTTAVTDSAEDWWADDGVFGVTATVIVGLTGRACVVVVGAAVFSKDGVLVAGTSGF